MISCGIRQTQTQLNFILFVDLLVTQLEWMSCPFLPPSLCRAVSMIEHLSSGTKCQGTNYGQDKEVTLPRQEGQQ